MNKKTNFLLHLIFIIGCSNIVDEDSLIEKDTLKYSNNSNSPYTGEVIGKYPSGEERVRGNYVKTNMDRRAIDILGSVQLI